MRKVKDTPLSPKTHPTRHIPPILLTRFTGIRGVQRVTTEEFSDFSYRCHSTTIATPSCCGSSARWGKRQQSTSNSGNGRRNGNMTAKTMDGATTTRQQCNGHSSGTAMAGSVAAAWAAQEWWRQCGFGRGGGGYSTAAAGSSRVAGQRLRWQHGKDNNSATVAAGWQWWWRRQRGGGGQLGSLTAAWGQRGGSVAAAWQQCGSSLACLAVTPRREVRAAQRWRWRQRVGGGRQCVSSAYVGSATEAGIAVAAAATAVLPPVEVKITIMLATNKQ